MIIWRFIVLPERVREILEEARKRILALEAERDELQEHLIEKQQSAEDAEYELQQKIAMLQEEVTSLREDLHDQGVREERETLAIVRAEREARTLSARTTALQEQLAVTEEKVAAEKSRKEALQNELERMTGKLLGAEHQLREMQQEYQKTLAQLQQIAEKNKILQKENEQLQKENEQLTILNKNIEQRGLAAENESLKTQIAHLESALQSDLTERGTFLEHMTSDKEALAKAEVEMKNLRESNFKLQEELEKATQKLNIYSKAGLLDLTEKDLANIFMKHKEESSGGMSAKENIIYTQAVEDLRQAHSELQLLYREKMLELEKITSTLTSHAETYKALENQVAKVTQESQEKEADFLLTIKNLQEVIKRRDERCEKMEHQMLMITDKGLKEKLDDLGHNLTRTVNLGKHDNVLEFHIDKVLFEAPEFNLLKTFVSWTVPFSLEDPLQHTNVAIGIDARYNYSALYKFQMNFRNLVSLRDDNVTVSVYILLDSGHPAKVGECYLSFSEVLDHPRNTLHGTVQVLVAFDDAEVQHLPVGLHLQPGEVVGTMSYWFNLQRPCEEVIAQHMRTVGVLAASQHYQDFVPKVSEQQTCSSEESSSSDTMFEESSESDTHIDEAPQLQSVHKAPENLAIEAKSSKDLGRKGGIRSSMSIHSKRGQETCSTSSPRISNSSSQVTGSQLSLAEASLATDSEGVVAVVSNKYKEKQLRIYVEVCSLVLYADSSVIQDPSVEFLFVDYHGFLGLPPDQLETPMSLPKPPPGCSLNFNFGQEFIIDQEQHPEREQALVDLMKNRGIIKFTVTSEPPEELQDSHDCQDLGYAFVNLHELLKKGQDLHDAELTVESADDGSQLGVLCITLHIVDVLKHLNITYQ
ncbi:hypothetical protein OTU49_017133 [Cherax quadricarinatus]|uniref:Uncharacterized protein n=1 Tax=Cherax quadricarinatus TaxID=27406 RepID=A0AAW0XQ70_CHEQU